MSDPLKTAAKALLIFASWRHDVVSAGFNSTGSPARAYRLLNSAVTQAGPIKPALEAAEIALAEWVATWDGSSMTRTVLEDVREARLKVAGD